MECIVWTSCRQNFYKRHLTWERGALSVLLSHRLSQYLNIRMKVVSTAANKPHVLMYKHCFDPRAVSKEHTMSVLSQSHCLPLPFCVALNECAVYTLVEWYINGWNCKLWPPVSDNHEVSQLLFEGSGVIILAISINFMIFIWTYLQKASKWFFQILHFLIWAYHSTHPCIQYTVCDQLIHTLTELTSCVYETQTIKPIRNVH